MTRNLRFPTDRMLLQGSRGLVTLRDEELCLQRRCKMPHDGIQRAWFEHEGAERAWRWWGIHVEEPRGTRIRVRPQAAFDPDSPIEGSDASNTIPNVTPRRLPNIACRPSSNSLLALRTSGEVPAIKQKRWRMHEKRAELRIRISSIIAYVQHLARAKRFDKRLCEAHI